LVFIINREFFCMVPDSNVKDKWNNDTDSRKDGQIDTHLVNVINQTVCSFTTFLTPNHTSFVHHSTNNLKVTFMVENHESNHLKLTNLTNGDGNIAKSDMTDNERVKLAAYKIGKVLKIWMKSNFMVSKILYLFCRLSSMKALYLEVL